MADGEQDDSQKTEEPTPKKIQEARKKGQVALSRELNNWVMLFVATLIIAFLFSSFMTDLSLFMRMYIEQSYNMPMVPGGLYIVLGGALKQVLWLLFPLFLFLFVAAFLATFLQVGPLFAVEIIKPDISKISPIKGFFRLFSQRALMEFVKGIFKICMIGVVGAIIVSLHYNSLDSLIDISLGAAMQSLKMIVLRMMTGILIALLVIAVADLAYQRYEYYKKMRMTRQEVRDEYKQAEGDPHIKARLRKLRMEKAQQRIMQAVPKADVVITNPTHYSVALQYDPENMGAPVCVAKGINELALRIREIAKEHDIVIYESPPLARALYDTIEIDETIKTEHYKAVAEIISYVFKLKGRLGKK